MEFVDPHISSVKNNRAVLEEIKRLSMKIRKLMNIYGPGTQISFWHVLKIVVIIGIISCDHNGPYCTEFETEEDFELHNKLWHR